MNRKHLIVAMLLVIAAGNAWMALVERQLPPFHLAIGGLAVILAVVVALSRYEFPVRSALVKQQTPARRRLGVVLAVSGSLASVLWIAFGPWNPAADFDVTGILFLIQNVGQLVMLGILVVAVTTGLALLSGH